MKGGGTMPAMRQEKQQIETSELVPLSAASPTLGPLSPLLSPPSSSSLLLLPSSLLQLGDYILIQHIHPACGARLLTLEPGPQTRSVEDVVTG